MRLVPAKDFLSWALEQRIGQDERYPNSDSLVYKPPGDEWGRLPAPTEEFRLLPFLSDAIDGLGSWKECFAWHRKGAWPDFDGMRDAAGPLYSYLLAGAGIPLGFDGAVGFNNTERNRLIAVTAAPILFGRTIWEDVLLFPDHGKFFLMFDHHQDLYLKVSDSTFIAPFIGHMQERGHEVDE